MRTSQKILTLLIPILAACGGGGGVVPPPGGGEEVGTLTLSPDHVTVEMGSPSVTFASTLTGATGGVQWDLVGPGSISPTDQATTVYTPPASGTPGTAILTVKGGGTSKSTTLTIAAAQSLVISPGAAEVVPRSAPAASYANLFTFVPMLAGIDGTIAWDMDTAAPPFPVADGCYVPPDPGTVTQSRLETVSASLGSLRAESAVIVDPAALNMVVLSPMAATVFAGAGPLTLRGVLAGAPFNYGNVQPPQPILDPDVGTVTAGTVDGSTMLEVIYTPPAVVSTSQVVRIRMVGLQYQTAPVAEFYSEITVEPPPTLNVSPAAATVVAGGERLDLTGTTTIEGPIWWSIDLPAQLGTLSQTEGGSISYTPPPASQVTAPTQVTITARASPILGGLRLSKQIVVTVLPAL